VALGMGNSGEALVHGQPRGETAPEVDATSKGPRSVPFHGGTSAYTLRLKPPRTGRHRPHASLGEEARVLSSPAFLSPPQFGGPSHLPARWV
jgi:hypothetical protein